MFCRYFWRLDSAGAGATMRAGIGILTDRCLCPRVWTIARQG